VQRQLARERTIGKSVRETAKEIARWYWHTAVTLEEFLKYYVKNKKGTIWRRKPDAPKSRSDGSLFPDGFYWPEALAMEKIESEYVTVRNPKIKNPKK